MIDRDRYVLLLVAAAAVGAALAGCHPTSYSILDYLYPAALGGLVSLSTSIAPRGLVIVATVVGVGFSRGWLLVPAVAAVIAAFAIALPARPHRTALAAVGALEVQVLLRWPNAGFHGLTALVAGAVVAALLVGAWTAPVDLPRRSIAAAVGLLALAAIVVSVPALAAAYRARSAADRAETSAKAALNDIEAGQAPQAVDDLQAAGGDFSTAHDQADPWWSWGSVLVPVVAQQHHAVTALTRSGLGLARDGARRASAIDFHAIRAQHGQVDLAALSALTVPLEDLQAHIAATLGVAADQETGWLVSPLQRPLSRLSADLVKADQSIKLALQASQQVPTLLGAHGEKHYLVVFMTPAETRGLGGFLGAYAEVDVDNGRLTVAKTGQPRLLVDPSGTPRITGPADYLARYGQFDPQDYPEDISYSPDFPTVADVLSQVYPQLGGDRVDGVLVLDPDTLATLLQFTGPITISGFPEALDSANAATILLKTQYLISEPGGESGRHDLLQGALAVGFQRLTSISLPSPKALGAALGPDVRQGRLLFWTPDPAAEALIDRLGLDGSFPSLAPGPSALSAVTIANAANNKMDAYLTEQTQDAITYDPGTGAVDEQLTVTFTNRGSASLPQYVSGSYVGSGLPAGTDESWVSVYTPWAVQDATLDGQPLQMTNGTSELGVNAFSYYVKVPPGAAVVLRVGISGATAVGSSFSDTIRQQPLANPSSTVVTVTPSGGWQLVPASPASWTLGTDEVESHEWKFTK